MGQGISQCNRDRVGLGDALYYKLGFSGARDNSVLEGWGGARGLSVL